MKRLYLLSIIAIVLSAFLMSGGVGKISYAQGEASVTKLIQLSQKYVQQEKWSEAKNCAKRAVQADPNSDDAWSNYDKVILGATNKTSSKTSNEEEEEQLEGC